MPLNKCTPYATSIYTACNIKNSKRKNIKSLGPEVVFLLYYGIKRYDFQKNWKQENRKYFPLFHKIIFY